MKKTYRIIITAILCFGFHSSSWAQSPNGDSNIPFAMTRDSVKAMFGRQNCTLSFESNGGYANHLYLNYEHYYHAGDSCSILLTFYKNLLAAYVISDYKNDKPKAAFKKRKKSLQHQYGKPATSTKNNDRTTISWILEPKEAKDPKEVIIELVKGENKETGILEQYLSKEEYEWREKNPGQKVD